MPPPGSFAQSNAAQNTAEIPEPYYSNEDVAILHDIVVLAQELLPKLPERERLPTNALFSAYYDILPRVGVDADHDSRYARVLFKIGGLRGAGTLYEKFEEILSRMGIEIEFDHENVQNGEEYSQLEDSQVNIEIVAAQTELPQRLRTRRRNSESSAWDLGIEPQSQPRTRRSSYSIVEDDRSRINNEKATSQETHPEPLGPRSNNSQLPQNEDADQNYNIGAWLNSNSKPRKPRGRSVSTHGSLRIRRRSTSAAHRYHHQHAGEGLAHPSERELAESEATAITSSSVKDVSSHSQHRSVHQLNEASDTLMDVKASLISQHYLKASTKQQLRHWRDLALQARQDNIELDLIAEERDRRALFHSVLSSWRQSSSQKRGLAKTIAFFIYLEERASKARDLYLMHTAVSHWSTCAEEQVQRTALARRHIVRFRIFNAWRDITAVNELKVRRHVLKKFFSTWKRQHSLIAANDGTAVQIYEANLVLKLYKQWIWRLMGDRATRKWAEATRRRTLFRWIVVSHNHWESHCSAGEFRRAELTWNTWRVWKAKTDDWSRQNQHADAHYCSRLLQCLLRRWRRETQVKPAQTAVQSDVAVRTLRDAFKLWVYRTHQEREAAATNRSRMLGEALTLWRHNSRQQALSRRINHRVAADALYMWLSSERIRCSQLWFVQRRQRGTLRSWVQKWKAAREQRWELEDLSQSFAVQKVQNFVLHNWYSKMESRQQLITTATELHASRLMQRTFANWAEQAQHTRTLQQWSKDAEFYFVVSKALKRWKSSTENSRREKRKEAYSQVRRMLKMNLVRTVFQGYRDKTQKFVGLRMQADDVRRNKDMVVAKELLDRWRARGDEVTKLTSLCRGSILTKHLTNWRNRSSAVLALDTEAIYTYQELRVSRALKRWSLLALQLGAQSNYAADVREKNAKKNFRKIFSYWRLKAIQRRPPKKIEFAATQPLGYTGRDEAWSDFGEDLDANEWAQGSDEVTASTPVPGYLSTPSKRSERVMAVAARFSTTPKAPLTTPFERQLRAQWSGGPLPSQRRPPGRSTLGMSRGFADILETSMNND